MSHSNFDHLLFHVSVHNLMLPPMLKELISWEHPIQPLHVFLGAVVKTTVINDLLQLRLIINHKLEIGCFVLLSPFLDLGEVATGMGRTQTWEYTTVEWNVDMERDGSDVGTAHYVLTERIDTVILRV